MSDRPGPIVPLHSKARALMGALVVSRTAHPEGALARLPRYVAENLLGQYGAADAARLVADHYPAPDRREALLHTLVSKGTVTVLDHATVRVDLTAGRPYAWLSALAPGPVAIDDALLDRFPALLGPGMWAAFDLGHRPEMPRHHPKVVIRQLRPVSTQVNLAQFVDWRRHFTLDEWIDLWLYALGYDPVEIGRRATSPERIKWLLLARLLPLVEPQYNLIELGPKNTGKTYLYRNAAAGSFVVSGGTATPAHLFINLRTGQKGIIASTTCVVFDEVGGLRVDDAFGTVGILKDYMESGHFSRGGREYSADASVVFLGNLATEGGQPASYYRHLLQTLPDALRDPAVIDRLHGFLPGWEIPKLTPAAVAAPWGLAADYVAAVLQGLRTWPVEEPLAALLQRHPLRPTVTKRDERALRKTVRGFLKLLFPTGAVSDAEARQLLAIAAELRQRVHLQLTAIDPGEFTPRTVGFEAVEPWPAPDLNRLTAWDATDHRLNRAPRPGEITGLLVRVDGEGRPVDGDVQVIEASVFPGSGELRLTGFHGQAMEESARAAYHFLREHLADFQLATDALQGTVMAVHLVAIEVAREGASAGLAFLLAMVSALTGRPVRPALAVTGEVSLHGDIGAVGGLVPKLYAALRHGRQLVLVPAANRGEVAELDPSLREALTIRPVATVADALREAFGLTAVRGGRSG